METPQHGLRPPPLPPKGKKVLGSKISGQEAIKSLNGTQLERKQILSKESPPRIEAFTAKSPSLSCQSADENRATKKSFSLNSRKANGIVGKIASAFSEPSAKRSENGFKIITWAEKNHDAEKKCSKRDEEFLYQNVSSAGTNYIEYKLKNIISNEDTHKRKTTMKGQDDKFGNNKVAYKAAADTDQEKTTPHSSPTWMTAPTKQIQVHHVKNKTVVKISVNDCPDVPSQNKENFFKPLKDDDLSSTSEYQYPELLFNKNRDTSVNEYAEPFRGDPIRDLQLYANVDLSKKRMNQQCGLIYENTDVSEEDIGQVYMNVGNGEVYANLDAEDAVPVLEHHYLNVNGTFNVATVPRPAPDDSDQVYENQDFSVLRNSIVTQSVIQNNSSPVKEDVYENTEFTSKNNVLEDIKFSGPGLRETSGYQTPRSALRLVVNEVDPEMLKIKNKYVINNFVSQEVLMDEGQYSPSETFDSGTGSDPENASPIISSDDTKESKVVVTVNGQEDGGHKRAESITSSGVGVDSEVSDTEESNISCDSLNSNDLHTFSVSEDHGYHTPTSEHKTASPIDGIEYQNIDDKTMVVGDKVYKNTLPLNTDEGTDGTDIIQQVANAAERIKNLRIENTGMYLARRIKSCDDVYENLEVYENYNKTESVPKALPVSINNSSEKNDELKSLPKGLLRDIQSRNVRVLSAYPKGEKPSEQEPHSLKGLVKITPVSPLLVQKTKNESEERKVVVNERTYEERKTETHRICGMELDPDKFYKFHLFENAEDNLMDKTASHDETFAGFRDYLNRERPAAITSAKGTIRGVKNRVKAGIATFLQLQENKVYKDKDAGKIVVYSTTMGIVRETYQKCLKVKQILKTLMVKFEERDVFMSTEAQEEIRERMKCDAILVPQVFVEGQHVGDAETIERLNETGELRKILKPYKCADAGATCNVCGGYRLLPCRVCKGSKKSIHRNNFTAEFVSLKCMSCDPVGLMKCYAC